MAAGSGKGGAWMLRAGKDRSASSSLRVLQQAAYQSGVQIAGELDDSGGVFDRSPSTRSARHTKLSDWTIEGDNDVDSRFQVLGASFLVLVRDSA